jgi:hypothetical protein
MYQIFTKKGWVDLQPPLAPAPVTPRWWSFTGSRGYDDLFMDHGVDIRIQWALDRVARPALRPYSRGVGRS